MLLKSKHIMIRRRSSVGTELVAMLFGDAMQTLVESPTREDAALFKRWNLWLIFLGLWTFIAFISAVQSYVREEIYVAKAPPVTRVNMPVKDMSAANVETRKPKSHFKFLDHMRWAMEVWYTRAIISPMALWIAMTIRIRSKRKLGSISVHLACSLLIDMLVLLELAGVRHALEPRHPAFWGEFKYAASDHVVFNFLVYWTLVGFMHVWHYSRDSRQEALQRVRLSKELAETQLTMLKAQLQPHFLFNALHSIGTLVHEDPNAAENMLLCVGQLLRTFLEDKQSDEVTLRKELATLEYHLEVERIRFGDRLTIHTAVDAATLDCAVPHLILQPLVENAIRYGIGKHPGPDEVRILARRAGESLQLEVWNSNSVLEYTSEVAMSRGIGLSNSRLRLSALYPDQCSLRIANVEPCGVSATVTIPFRLMERKETLEPHEYFR
jgi:two-component system, LytTR family, sensor kinase